MSATFEELFQTDDPRGDKFLSRLFGLFNEDVVRHWAAQDRAAYRDLGRPTLRYVGEKRWHTLDFTLQNRSNGKVFVSEMKCELEYEGYRYLRLREPSQTDHHRGRDAFRKFLGVAAKDDRISVTVGGKPQPVDGAILVWGALSPEGKSTTMNALGLADVLSVEEMVADLRKWRVPEWRARVDELRRWSNGLFDSL